MLDDRQYAAPPVTQLLRFVAVHDDDNLFPGAEYGAETYVPVQVSPDFRGDEVQSHIRVARIVLDLHDCHGITPFDFEMEFRKRRRIQFLLVGEGDGVLERGAHHAFLRLLLDEAAAQRAGDVFERRAFRNGEQWEAVLFAKEHHILGRLHKEMSDVEGDARRAMLVQGLDVFKQSPILLQGDAGDEDQFVAGQVIDHLSGLQHMYPSDVVAESVFAGGRMKRNVRTPFNQLP